MNNEKCKKIIKILIGVAWIDGAIQPEEREYLHRKAKDNKVADDPEIKLMLSEAKPIEPNECYVWLKDYLNTYNTEEDYYYLLERISNIVYKDNVVHTEETKLLTKLQELNPVNKNDRSILEKIIQTIQTIYKSGVNPKA
ncbi:MAG: TerB family tellurite resistance protein [Prochloraceae cyanobacterium]